MARSTVSTTVQRIRRQLDSSYRYEVAMLATALDADASNVTVTLSSTPPPSFKSGSVISIDAEDMRVIAVDTGNRQATVLRNWTDTALAQHAEGAEVRINPRFTGGAIFDAIHDELDDWGPDLYRVVGAEVTVAECVDTIELPADFTGAYHVIEVRRAWTDSDSTAWPQLRCRVQQSPIGSWSAATASGILLRPTEPVRAGSLFVIAAMPFDHAAMTLDSDLVDEIEIPSTALEVIDLGVKIRLMHDAENNLSARTAQDDPRRNEETPAGQSVGVARAMRQIYLTRRANESRKLNSRYPIRTT